MYNPESLTAPLEVYVNDTLVSELSVDRSRQIWSRAITTVGHVAIKFVSGSVEKNFQHYS